MCFRLISRFGTSADWSARIWEVPHVSKPHSYSGARVWNAAYTHNHDRIIILAIYHGAQLWPEAF